MKHKRFQLVRRLLAPVILLALLAGVAGNLQAIVDYARLYDYHPPSAVLRLADQTTMTDKARRLFYINHPVVAGRSAFNTDCNSLNEQTIILGCYHSGDRGIFLFEVADARLNGVEQVTAAHEMLHAAYDRLSPSKRQEIDAQLQDFYDTQVQDKRIRDTMAAYQKSEPKDIHNEMHSIFATEILTLTPSLEQYYQQYFSNRHRVAQFADAYQSEFTSRQDQVKAYDAELKALKQQIDQNSSSLVAQEKDITTKQHELESSRSSGNLKAYNAAVPGYNAQVDRYNALITTTQASIARYNELVSQRNAVALEFRDLTQSISSQLTHIGQ